MIKRILSWGIAISLLLTLLPAAAATEGSGSEAGQQPAETAQCTCGAQPDGAGVVVHTEGCPLAFEEASAPGADDPVPGTEAPVPGTEDPVPGTETPVPGTEDPVPGTEDPAPETEDPAPETEDPPSETEDPASETEDPAPGTEDPASETEDPASETEDPASETEDPAPETLTPPSLVCKPLDELNSSDMILTVEGQWDSYAWEACGYGNWFAWAGDGPGLILSKEDFTSYGFRCTVALGEQSVTSEVFAYDPSVLEPPAMSLMADVLSGGPLSGSSGYIRYYQNTSNKCFDIQGMDGGSPFQTTYANGGYRTAISVNGSSKVMVPYQSNAVSVGNSLTARTALDIVYGGRYVKITYTVTNSGSTTQDFRIGSSADVMIGSNDCAEVTGTSTGLSMNGAPKNNYEFSLVAPDCTTLWYGFYIWAYGSIFKDLEDKGQGYSGDSGMAWSWSGSVAPGQTWSRYVLIGAGDLPEAPQTPTLELEADPIWKAGQSVTITGTASGSNTVYVNFNGAEYTGRVEEDGTFSIPLTVPRDMPAGPSSFSCWSTTEEGGISAIRSYPVTIVTPPSISLTTQSLTVMEGDQELDEVWLRSLIQSYSGTVTLSAGSVDTDKPGVQQITYTAQQSGYSDATALLTVTVLPQPAALTRTTFSGTGTFTLSSTMTYTGGLTYIETGFVYGALKNPTLDLNDGRLLTAAPVTAKGSLLSAVVEGSKLAYGVTYYARAYAIASDHTIIYGEQSAGFGMGAPSYGAFSVKNNGDNTFTVTRSEGTNGTQTVYYRTVNGSAVGGTHFEHQSGMLTFSDGDQSSQTVKITEHSVTSTYRNNAATAYSNADRTYSLEIYRVVGGATIGTGTATRTLSKDQSYIVDDKLFNAYQTSTPSGETLRGDYDDDNLGWSDDGDKGSAASSTLDFSALLPQQNYWKTVAQELWYKFSMQAKEKESGYQHIQIVLGDTIDTSFYPFEGQYKADSDDSILTSLNGDQYTALYAVKFEHGGNSKNQNYASYYFPKGSGTNPDNCSMTEFYKSSAYTGSEDHLVIASSADGTLDVGDLTLTVGFGGSGENSDEWYSNKETHYFKLSDTREPQLLGVAPMAEGSYMPGDSVTVALIFEEIVDKDKSTDLNKVKIETNWGTFSYAGGADTNVLYFTGTVSDTASGDLKVISINGAESIKDMADDIGQNTSGTVTDGGTGAGLGSGANAPTVTVDDISESNGTLTASVSASPADVKLEYVWSASPSAPAAGWQIVASGSTVSTRQTSGTWYLHARATNGDGVTRYASKSYTFDAGVTVTPPSLTVTADNANWAKTREITVTRTPSDAAVTVKTPDGTTADVIGGAYTATVNGTYTFTLTSGSDTITQMVTVSKIDPTPPTVEIAGPTNTSHTRAVTLTVYASDGGSGIQSVTGSWSSGSTTVEASLSGSDGVYTAISPDRSSGTWTLTVTAADRAGNTAGKASAAYTVDLSVPTVTVTKQSDTGNGVTYSYAIVPGNSQLVSVQLPEGFSLDQGVSLPTGSSITGSLTFTQSGAYHIIVTDEAGHVVQSDSMEVNILRDLVAPMVRLSAVSNDAAGLTVNVSVFEVGGTAPAVAVAGGGSQTVPLSPDGEGVYTGSFSVTAAGTYTVTAKDAAGNEGTAQITVYAVTFDGDGVSVPAQLVASGDCAFEPAAPVRTGYTFNGWYQNDALYDFRAAVTETITLTARWTAHPAAAPAVSTGQNVTQPYGTENGTVSVSVTETAGYTYTYQWYSGTDSAGGGTELPGAAGSSCPIPANTPVGTHNYYCVVTARRDDNNETAATTSGVITVTITHAGQTAPNNGEGYTIDYAKETITIAAGYEVRTEEAGGSAVSSGSLVDPGSTLYIRKPGSETHSPSDWTEIHIPARLAAPTGIVKTDETVKGKSDGTVSGITAEMEYQIDGDGAWHSGPATLDRLSAETVVTVRYPATAQAFASQEIRVTVGAGSQTLTVTFNANGGTDVADAGGLSYGDRVPRPADPTRTGYAFDGWYSGETKWDFGTDTVTEDLALTAKWTPVTYAITYDLGGGSLAQEQSNPASYTVETATFSLNNPAKTGYTFAGWTEGGSPAPQETVTILQGSTGDKTYTAHWTLDAPAVTLDADKTAAIYGETITLTARASHDTEVSYTYVWYRDGQVVPGETDSTLELTGAEESGSYTVQVTADDGTLTSVPGTSDAVPVRIAKANPVATWPAASVITYGDSLGESLLSGGSAVEGTFAWKDGSVCPTSGSHTYTVTFTPADRANYETVEQTVTVEVRKALVTPTAASAADKVYDGGTAASGTVSLTGGVLNEQPAASGLFTFENADAGENKTVSVAVTLEGSWGDNYTLSTRTLKTTAAITPKTVSLVWQGYENLVYTGQPVSVTAQAAGLAEGDACAVLVTGGSESGAGDHTATATGLDNPNYQLPADGTSLTYSIAKAAGTASVAMAGWTYGEPASSPVPVSDTHGTDSVTYRYTGTDGTSYDSAAVPTDAGCYTVTATFAATDNYAEATAAASFTVAPRPVFATWGMLSHVYDGTGKAAEATLSGVLNTDACTLSAIGYQYGGTPVSAPVDAGAYTAAAALTGSAAHNYALQNGTATLTIQPRPVIFTVTGNTVQADGGAKEAAVAPDGTQCSYTVAYRQDGTEVSGPKAAGSYEIWVKITDPNCRHTDGSDLMQVGTLTITQAPPVVYTASFAGGEHAGGAAPERQTAPAGGQIILPVNPFTRAGYRFIGWKADGGGRLCQPGDSFAMPARDITFTAQWEAVFTASGGVTETDADGTGTAVENAVVSLWLGANKIGETTTESDGTYRFDDLIPGIYNLVVTKDVRTVTSLVTITDANQTQDTSLPAFVTNSVVAVALGSPDIVVGQLDQAFTESDQAAAQGGSRVELIFTAEEMQPDKVADDLARIDEKAPSDVKLSLVMDYTITKTVTTVSGGTESAVTEPVPQAPVPLEILLPLPSELQGKYSYSVYRVHSSTGTDAGKEAQELKQGEAGQNDLGEYFTVNSDKTVLTLHVKCFSTYAVGYTDAAVNPGGHQGGSSVRPSKPTFPPSIAQPEHGAVSVSPQSPEEGQRVTVTPAPEQGYAVDEVLVSGPTGKPIEVISNGDGTYAFIQPDGKAAITVTFRKITDASDCPRDESCPLAGFSDTDPNAWYHDGIHYCVEAGLMRGTSQSTFTPNAAITRGMIVTILWRLEGSPLVDAPMDYDDVEPEDWCGEAVRWAGSAGVASGYGDGRFGPDNPITREQLAAMLWRYAGSPHTDGSLSSFADGAQTSGWAQPAMIWAVEQGLIAGVSRDRLAPQGQATRAQAATILMRFSKTAAT